MRMRHLLRAALALAMLLGSLTIGAGRAAAVTPAPHWTITSFAAPTFFKPGDTTDRYQLIARNDGAAPTDGSTVTVADTLPPGVTATKIEGEYTGYFVGAAGNRLPLNCDANALSCKYEPVEGGGAPVVSPGDTLWITITVSVAAGAQPCSSCTATVEGGGAPSASVSDPTTIESSEAPFGFSRFSTDITDASGEPDRAAGSHPFELTTAFALNIASLDQATSEAHNAAAAPADVKDVNVALPPGMVGDPNAVPRCSQFDFEVVKKCPWNTQVGWVTLLAYGTQIEAQPSNEAIESAVYNIAPPPGQPAELGFQPDNFPIRVFFHVRSDGSGDYGITAQTSDITQFVPAQMAIVTLWGVPADPSHDQERRGAEGEQQCEHAVGQKEHEETLQQKRNAIKAKQTKIEHKENQLERAEQEGEGEKRISELEGELQELNTELSTLEGELSVLELEGPPKAAGCPSGIVAKPFLTMPTSCQGGPLALDAEGDSWAESGRFVSPLDPSTVGPLAGCEDLAFNPSITVKPETTQAASPSGYTVDLRVPQNEEPGALATPDLRKSVVTLPAGTVPSPSAADGLQACTDNVGEPAGSSGNQFGRLSTGGHSTEPASCPPASQIGTVVVHTPLLSSPLQGQLFLGEPECSPCTAADAQQGRMIRLFLQVQGSGVIVKLEGRTSLNEATGQLTTTFDENPQLPFDELELTIEGGSRAPLANPSTCGVFTTTSDLEPWSAPFSPDATPSDTFEIGGCGPERFAPAFSAGTINNQAGAFSPFTLTFSRGDSDQQFQSLTVHTPPGLLGMLSSVQRCPEPQASSGTCPAQSEIGKATVASGPGPNPFYLGGNVFLTGPYKGAPFGLSVVVHALAGPFDLGEVIVRSAIAVDPYTSAITVTSDPLPPIIDGVPTQIKTVNVLIDREGFMFNPTNCSSLKVDGALTSTKGTSAPVSSSFEAANCAKLPFKPNLTALTEGKTSKASGASLHVKVTSSPGQANIAKTALIFPKALPARLTTLQKACLAAVFAANPAACPPGSVIGTATIHTRVLNGPLTGPGYLVSHGNEAFPDAEFVMQGEGVTIILDGQTNIRKGITSSTFNALPDAPFTTFDAVLPEGPHSAFAATGNFCKQKLQMPTTITGQNGAVIKRTTRIAVSGCHGVKGFKAKKRKHKKKHKHKNKHTGASKK